MRCPKVSTRQDRITLCIKKREFENDADIIRGKVMLTFTAVVTQEEEQNKRRWSVPSPGQLINKLVTFPFIGKGTFCVRGLERNRTSIGIHNFF